MKCFAAENAEGTEIRYEENCAHFLYGSQRALRSLR